MSGPDTRLTYTPDPRYPPYGVGVCVCLLGAGIDRNGTDRTGRVFMGRLPWEGNQWTLVHGGVEPYENPIDTALREIGEELGTEGVRFVAAHRTPHKRDFNRWDDYRGKMEFAVLALLEENAEINLDANEEKSFVNYRWDELRDVPRNCARSRRHQYGWMANTFAALPAVLKSMPHGSSDEDRLDAVLRTLEHRLPPSQPKLLLGASQEILPRMPVHISHFDQRYFADLRAA